MNEGVSFQEFPQALERSSKKSRIIVAFIILLLIAVGILIGLYLLGSRAKKPGSRVSPIPTPTITQAPSVSPTATVSATISPSPSGKMTATPKVTPTPGSSIIDKATGLDRSKLQISVLNGSGVPGAAKQISSSLANLGYTITSVGNADAFTYQGITIKIKKSASAYLPLLKKDVGANASNATITSTTDNTIAEDAEVIVGK